MKLMYLLLIVSIILAFIIYGFSTENFTYKNSNIEEFTSEKKECIACS